MMSARLRAALAPILDLLLLPLTVPAALLLKAVRRIGLQRMPLCRAALLRIGVLPVRRHYYEPFADPADFGAALDRARELPGIDWNETHQLAVLDTLRYEKELTYLDQPRVDTLDFRLGNGSFESGDAEFLYQFIRARKPRRVVEVGSGNSTLIARDAIRRNGEESREYRCTHTCIEPFEAPWLEHAGVCAVRTPLERVDAALFRELEAGDLLFIDSSHVIRPQGDVLVEYLQILPALRPGVVVHIHDIFSPRDYLREWLAERMLLWNEQYLLEAFLTQNDSWRIIAALNLLKHRHFAILKRVCPYLTADREPGSFYIEKVR
jgi:hypothetical protein